MRPPGCTESLLFLGVLSTPLTFSGAMSNSFVPTMLPRNRTCRQHGRGEGREDAAQTFRQEKHLPREQAQALAPALVLAPDLFATLYHTSRTCGGASNPDVTCGRRYNDTGRWRVGATAPCHHQHYAAASATCCRWPLLFCCRKTFFFVADVLFCCRKHICLADILPLWTGRRQVTYLASVDTLRAGMVLP